MARNKLKNKQAEETEELKEAPVKKKRKINVNLNWSKDNRLKQIFGWTFILFSLVLLISFCSFLFTGKHDQNLLNVAISELETEETYRNWLGKFGAVLAQQLMGDWFGLASFVMPVISFLIGFKLLFGTFIIPFKTVLKYALFTLLWLPVFCAYILPNGALDVFAGGVGIAVSNYLQIGISSVGIGLTLLFTLLFFVQYNFNPQWAKIFAPKHREAKGEFDDDELDDPLDPVPPMSLDLDDEDLQPHMKVEESGESSESSESGESSENLESLEDLESLEGKESFESFESDDSEEDDESETPAFDGSLELEVEENGESLEGQESLESQEDLESLEGLDDDDDLELSVEESGTEEKELSKSDIERKLEALGPYDPKLDLGRFKLPKIDLLADHGGGNIEVNREELEQNKTRIVNTLKNYKIEIQQIKATVGPSITLYEIVPAAGVRISKIKNLEDDIALSLSALGIRIIAPIPGRGTIGIEVPNQKADVVSMRNLIASEKFQNSKMDLPVVLGKTISNETYIADLAKMPHLLMAGATGQGKSVGLNAILVSLLYKKHPAEIKFVLVDPKKVELTLFNKIERHYLASLPDNEEPIITDTTKVVHTLNSLCIEMDNRYEMLKQAMVRNIKEYNRKFVARKLNPEEGHKYLPYIVLVIDEFADLIMTAGKEVETPIARLAQLARAIGIHLIIATQRPSVNVITGIIKANFPSRISFRVTSKIDSRTILDAGGADQLIGRGDMLVSMGGSDLIRLQCGFVDTPEVEEITDYIGAQQGYTMPYQLPEYIDENGEGSITSLADEDRDALFEEAARIIVQHQQGSASLLQRKLKLGYNRAGRIVDQLEAAGIIGPFEGSKARQVLLPDLNALEQLLNSSND